MGAFLVVAGKAGIRFKNETRTGRQTSIDGSSFAGAADEQGRRREQGERERDLRDDERIAREKSPAPPNDIFAGLFLEIGDHRAPGKFKRGPERESDRADNAESKSGREDRRVGTRQPDDIERQHFA